MISIKRFIFNSFQVNTYLLFDETGECLIIDAACEDHEEQNVLAKFIESGHLKPVRLIYTHCHVDHILGNDFITEKYHLDPEIHPGGMLFCETAREFGSVFGITFNAPLRPGKFINDMDKVTFGNSSLEVLYTPGHADGSICLLSKEQYFVIVGDVLFNESIGRTDLPTGNYAMLIKSIQEKLFTLDDKTVVYPGHGPETTIGYEKAHNPFVRVE